MDGKSGSNAIVDDDEIVVGELPKMQNLPEKCTQWCGNGPKVTHLGPKTQFLGHKRPIRPQMDGKVEQMVDHSEKCVGELP